MLTDAERQELYRTRIYTPAQRSRIEYWQSMWERSMHNPKNKPDIATHVVRTDLGTVQYPPSPHNPLNKKPEYVGNARTDYQPPKETVEMPGDLPYPERTTTDYPWAGVRGEAQPPRCDETAPRNAPCCTFTDKDLSILTEAHSLVHGDRQASYGHPAVDFSRTAALANALLAHRLDTDLGPEDVAMFLVCVKLSRECHEHKRDNLVDACGYLECRERVLRFLGDAALSRSAERSNAPRTSKDAL